MFRGSDFDRLAQQRIFAERDWIDAQPGLVAQGRAVCLFDAERTSPRFLDELLERFCRVWVFIDSAAAPEWISEIAEAGHHVYPYTVFTGRQLLDQCKSLIAAAPPLPGLSVVHLTDAGNPELVDQVQEFYQTSHLLPQPDYFVAGNDGTVITTIMLDAQGAVIGATMFHHLARVGPEYALTGHAASAVISPPRTPGALRNAGDMRRASLAAWLNAHAVVRSREQFDTREIWSNPRLANRRSIAFHRELGAIEKPGVSCFCAEHRTAPSDSRHGIVAPLAAAD
jgi:hypothetical protein